MFREHEAPERGTEHGAYPTGTDRPTQACCPHLGRIEHRGKRVDPALAADHEPTDPKHPDRGEYDVGADEAEKHQRAAAKNVVDSERAVRAVPAHEKAEQEWRDDAAQREERGDAGGLLDLGAGE